MQAACSASRYKDFLHLRLSGGVEICISKSLRPLHSQVFHSLRQLHCWCTFVMLLHLANGAPVWTKLMQWGRLLPVRGNTGSHLLSCLSSKRSSFTSQSRRSSCVCCYGRSEQKGWLLAQGEEDLPPAQARSAPGTSQRSLAGADTQRFLRYVLAAKANFYMERAHTTENKAMVTQKTAYETDLLDLPDTVDPGGFKWGRRLSHSSSNLKGKHVRAEPLLTVTKSCSVVMLLK